MTSHGGFGNVRYAVLPDDSPGNPCESRCSSGFGAQTVVASHELVEMVTDPYPGWGWIDKTLEPTEEGGEIADIC